MSILKNTLVVLTLTLVASASDLPHPLSDEFIDYINSKQDLWKAGRNFPEDTSLEYLKGLFGTILIDIPEGSTIRIHDADLIESLPESFDARDKWPNCPSINEIRDQGWCGSCWAHGAVEAMTDRWCIHSNNSQQFHFSAQDVTACASNSGCYGADPIQAWNMWETNGIVSGGNYESNEGCRPYEPAPCHTENCPPFPETPCVNECQANYQVSYQEDKRFGEEPYHINKEEHMMAEIYLNGPIEVDFIACPDIQHYKNGVYHTLMNPKDCPDGHAVKAIGWGVENGIKYWLLANSWSTNWGKLGGFFKFLRGENHLEIENGATAGMPNYKK